MILKLLKSQFVIYGIVGVGVTLLKLLSLYILRDIFVLNTVFSVVVSYIIAVVTHFFITPPIN